MYYSKTVYRTKAACKTLPLNNTQNPPLVQRYKSIICKFPRKPFFKLLKINCFSGKPSCKNTRNTEIPKYMEWF